VSPTIKSQKVIKKNKDINKIKLGVPASNSIFINGFMGPVVG
jgi:hypothetical protein